MPYLTKQTISPHLVINGEIHTPVPDCFLNGITRQAVIEIAKNEGIKVIERDIYPDEIKNAEEIFLKIF